MEYSDKIISAFQDETTDLLASFEDNILLLEKEPENTELINEIFRVVHSLKSESALMGFKNFSTLAHKFEDVFDLIRDGKLLVSSKIVDLAFRINDRFKELMGLIITLGNDGLDISDLEEALGVFFKDSSGLGKPDTAVQELKLTGEEVKKFTAKGYKNIFRVSVDLFDNVALKYARAFMIQNDLSDKGELAKANVNFMDDSNDDIFSSFSIIFLTNEQEKDIYNLIDGSEIEKISIKAISGEAKSRIVAQSAAPKDTQVNSIRVNVDKIEDMINSVGELLVNYNRMEKFYEDLSNKKFSFQKPDRAWLLDIIFQFKRIIDGLQDNSMKFRMVPIKTLFDKFPRLIRTISREMKKDVNLSISGENTEIDKNMVEEIREPLTHLIRNAIDHGVENKEKRLAKGKPGKGTIKISAYQFGNNIYIEVTDDGAGIDIERIKKKALQKSLVTKEKLKTLNRQQLLGLIFIPGFSTSENVTELSGRGVGMDVVKTNLKNIQGKVLIRTEKGKGSSFILSIPLTVAIIDALIIRSSNVFFAIPLHFIKETLRIYRHEIEIVDQYEVVRIRKKILSLYRLNEIFRLKDLIEEEDEDNVIFLKARQKRKERFFVVVIRYGNKTAGLIVDEMITEQDIVIKPLSKHIEGIEGISGAAILGDGNVAYILDPGKLIAYFLSQI